MRKGSELGISYVCDYCPYEVNSVVRQEILDVAFTYPYENFNYSIILHFIVPRMIIYKFKISDFCSKIEEIISFDYMPDITPSNIHVKLPTILTFL
jgi:hypothetical protein